MPLGPPAGLPRLIESRFMDGEASASRFESLYSAHSAEILRFAVRCGASRPDAEEIVEETFLVCWRRIGDVPEEAGLWLLGVAKHVMLNRRRSANRREALNARLSLVKPDPPSTSPRDDVLLEAMPAALARLAEGDREVLELLVWQGLTQEEAARVLGCSRNAVTKRFRKALNRLRALLPPVRT